METMLIFLLGFVMGAVVALVSFDLGVEYTLRKLKGEINGS